MEHQGTDPTQILQAGFGSSASKVLLTAVELEVFTVLAGGPLTGKALADRVGLHPRGSADFFDALVALGLLNRDGNGPDAPYRNTVNSSAYLDKNNPGYIGGILVMLKERLYRYWDDLGETLTTGRPQNEIKRSRKPRGSSAAIAFE